MNIPSFKKITALFLCLSSILTLAAGCGSADDEPESPGGNESDSKDCARSLASYPEMAPYPNETLFFDEEGNWDDTAFSQVYDAWQNDRSARLDQPKGYQNGMDAYVRSSMSAFLTGDNTENHVYSPLNIYMALGMLAEITDGNSRRQILDVLGASDLDELRAQAGAVWNANYCKDGAVTSVLASSLWLDEQVHFRRETLDSLAKHYYASSYQGAMGSAAFNTALQNWLDEQTGGLLKEQARNIELDEETIIALASTVYYQAKWSQTFSSGQTESGVFHAPGGDVTCDFMHQSHFRTYYCGERFAAVQQSMAADGGSMWFFLPDEGTDAAELLADDEILSLLMPSSQGSAAAANAKNIVVNFAVPKFDVASQLELEDGLRALGITDVFDTKTADFSALTQNSDDMYLSQAKHAARVTIDEDGCTAAAFTVMAVDGMSLPPDDEVDLILDRPFLFVLSGIDGLPLFIGIVNQP